MMRSAVALALLMCAALEPANAFVSGGFSGRGRLPQQMHRARAAAQRPAALQMQLTPQEKTRKTLVALGGLATFLVLLENVASPLMLQKLKSEKEEKAAKESQQK